jgi:alkanesulfonate monooxygenase SsuD/methylene tetrahydromethanopterin reductase-like flavin-dependent oxidoreductase (luciferase family)
MRIALVIQGQEGVTWEDWVALAGACETHGVETLFRSDHYMSFRGAEPALEAWGTTCALAAITTRLRLGTLVSPVTFRHPSVLAKLAVTADHISGGRVDVGLGAGWAREEHDAHDFAFPPVGERMALLERQLQVLRRERLSVIVGGNAGPRSLALAARYADEYNVAKLTPAQAAEVRDRLDARVRLAVMTGIEHAGLAHDYAAAGVDRLVLGHSEHRDLAPIARLGALTEEMACSPSA